MDNTFIVFNEIAVSTYLYILVGLSDYSNCNQEVRERMSWSLISTVFCSVAFNLAKTVFLIVKSIITKTKHKIAQDKLKRTINKERINQSKIVAIGPLNA